MAGVEEKYCTNCKRQIAVANFVMHEVHCKRNIVLCEQCKEPVPRSELDSHIEEEHATVPCNLCNSDVEKSKVDEHSKICLKRPMNCSFCELEVPFCDLGSHEDYCGTRTEPCPVCTQFIMLKDMIRHEQSSCSYPAPPKPATSVLNNTRVANRTAQREPPREDTDVLPNFYNSFAMDEISRMLNSDAPVRNDAQADSTSSRNVNVNDRLQQNRRVSNVSSRPALRSVQNNAKKKKVPTATLR